MIENMKRSEKYKLFKDCRVPRYLIISEKEKRREQIFWAFLAFMMLTLSIVGRNDIQKIFGKLALFFVSLFGVFDR